MTEDTKTTTNRNALLAGMFNDLVWLAQQHQTLPPDAVSEHLFTLAKATRSVAKSLGLNEESFSTLLETDNKAHGDFND